MNTTLKITLKEVYGQTKAYPACEQSEWIAKLAGTKTLTLEALRIAKDMGFTLQYVDRFGATENWTFHTLALRLAA
jgi:hypothetical protein